MKALISLFLIVLLASCQSQKPVGQKGVISKSDVLRNARSGGPIEIPMNANSETSKNEQLNMLVEFQNLSLSNSLSDPTAKRKAIEIDQNQLQVARIQLETSIAQIKRFDVFGIHSSGAVRALNAELEDVGDIEFSNTVQRSKIDLFLSANLLLSGEKRELVDGSDELTYAVTVKFSITDRKGSFVGRPIEKTGIAKRKQIKDIVTGKYLGGFSQQEEGKAIKEAIMDAMKQSLPAFGNEFPVTGTVNGVVPSNVSRMSIDRGSDQGLTNGNQMVVWYMAGGVVPVPIGYANVEAMRTTSGVTRSPFTIYRWDSSKEAKFVKNQLEEDPNWYKLNPIYATSYGISPPQEWE